MSVNSKMTAIADKIRALLGLSGTMGLDAMATNLQEANAVVGTQADLISQIQTALEGKAAGGGAASTTVTITTETLSGQIYYFDAAGVERSMSSYSEHEVLGGFFWHADEYSVDADGDLVESTAVMGVVVCLAKEPLTIEYW